MAIRGLAGIMSQLATVARTGNYGDLNNPPNMPPNVQRLRVQTDVAGNYTWMFPTPYGAGVTPIIMISVEDSAAGSSMAHRITAISNTAVTLQVSRTTAVTILGISVLGISASPQSWIHLAAIAP